MDTRTFIFFIVSFDRLGRRMGFRKFSAKRQCLLWVLQLAVSTLLLTTDILWWRGLARLLEIKGFIREGDDKIHVQVKYQEPTELGMEFVKSMSEQDFYVYPEADMLLTRKTNKPFSSFSEWGRGWADPEICRQWLEKMNLNKKPKMLPSPKNKRQRRRKALFTIAQQPVLYANLPSKPSCWPSGTSEEPDKASIYHV